LTAAAGAARRSGHEHPGGHRRRFDRRTAGTFHPAWTAGAEPADHGIVAALIGWWVAGKLGVQTTSGIDWLRWIISTIIAAVGIVIYGKVTSKA